MPVLMRLSREGGDAKHYEHIHFRCVKRQTQLPNDTSALFKALFFAATHVAKCGQTSSGVLSEETVGLLEWSGDAALASDCGRMLYPTPGLLSDRNRQVAI